MPCAFFIFKILIGEKKLLNKMPTPSTYRLSELSNYFLKLGTTGFGGPVALVAYMHSDLVVTKNWISEDEFKEGLALAQLAPGPLAAQLGIYLGFVHYGVLGATLAGFAFVLPSFIMVVLLGMAYKMFGGLAWMQAVFYGVSAAVVGIILISLYKLSIKSISKINLPALRQNWILWTFYIVAAVITFVTKTENIFVFLAAGFIYMFIKAPPNWRRQSQLSLLFLGFEFWQYEPTVLWKIAFFFARAGTFVFGSGLAIVPFLHAGVVTETRWLTEQQFVDAIAVAMITPGPVVITVGFIGYLVAGFPGALVAALATFLPCYIITIAAAPYFKKIAQNKSVKAFVDGITAAVIGALAGAVAIIGIRTIVDIPAILIAMFTVASLLFFPKIKEPILILVAAVVGLVIRQITLF